MNEPRSENDSQEVDKKPNFEEINNQLSVKYKPAVLDTSISMYLRRWKLYQRLHFVFYFLGYMMSIFLAKLAITTLLVVYLFAAGTSASAVLVRGRQNTLLFL